MYEEAVDYLDSIDEDDTVLVVNHWDMDGSCSAAIISKIIEEVRGDGADFLKVPEGRKHYVGESTERLVQKKDITKLIVLDISVPSDRVSELTEEFGLDVLVIDHHDFDRDPEKGILVNPRKENPDIYIPASKLCNDISKRFGLDLDWIAGLGIIQDFGVNQAMGLFEKLKRLHPQYFPSNLSQYNLAKNCRYGTYSSVMNVKPYKDTNRCSKLVFEVLTESRGIKYIESHDSYKELYKSYESVSQEIENIKENFEEEKEVYEDKKLVIFTFESPYHVNSSLATQISVDNKDWVFVTIRMFDGSANISSRCQSGRLDLGGVLRKSLPEDVDEKAEAGGHRKAAGASMSREHVEKFKENVIENMPQVE